MDGAGSVTGKESLSFFFLNSVANIVVDSSAAFSVNTKRIADPKRCGDIFSIHCTSNTEDQIGVEWTDSLTLNNPSFLLRVYY